MYYIPSVDYDMFKFVHYCFAYNPMCRNFYNLFMLFTNKKSLGKFPET